MPNDISGPTVLAASSTIDREAEVVTAWMREQVETSRADGDAPTEIAARISRTFPNQFPHLEIVEEPQVWGKTDDTSWGWEIGIGERSTAAERQIRESPRRGSLDSR